MQFMLDFLFGAPDGVSLALAPWIIPAALSGIQTLFALFGRGKKPKSRLSKADFMLSPEMEARMLANIKGRIGEQEQETLGAVRSSATRRGFYRSGQLPELEGKVRAAAGKDYAQAVTGVEINKADRLRRYAELKQGEHLEELRQFYGDEAGAGESLGLALENLLSLWDTYGGKGGKGGGRMRRRRNFDIPDTIGV